MLSPVCTSIEQTISNCKCLSTLLSSYKEGRLYVFLSKTLLEQKHTKKWSPVSYYVTSTAVTYKFTQYFVNTMATGLDDNEVYCRFLTFSSAFALNHYLFGRLAKISLNKKLSVLAPILGILASIFTEYSLREEIRKRAESEIRKRRLIPKVLHLTKTQSGIKSLCLS